MTFYAISNPRSRRNLTVIMMVGIYRSKVDVFFVEKSKRLSCNAGAFLAASLCTQRSSIKGRKEKNTDFVLKSIK